MCYLNLRTFILSLLRDESGAVGVEYALIVALVAVFIVGSDNIATEIVNLLNSMAATL